MLTVVMQAQEPSVASSWVQQHCLDTNAFNSSSSSSSWLDPGSCALLSHQCGILLQLGPVAAAAAQAQAEESLNQLWLTAQQVGHMMEQGTVLLVL